MKKILFAIIAICMANVICAKELTSEQIYKMNKDALLKILEYKANSNMNKPRRFVRLFENEDIQIYNDLLGLSNKKTLSVKEYRSLMENSALSPNIEIQNVRKKAIYFENGYWKMDIMFEKEISYADKCGVLFSTSEYYGKYHTIDLTLSWNDSLTSCYIVKLSGNINSSKNFLDDYMVISSSTDKRDKKRQENIRVDGKSLKFNSFDQCIIPAKATLTYEGDQDMKFRLQQQETGCEVYSIVYTPMSMRLKPHYNLGVSLLNGKFVNDGITLTKSLQHEIGLDLGYMIPSSSVFQLGFFAGLGLAISNMTYGIDSLSYYYNAPAEADIDGDTYMRYYVLKNLSQQLITKDLTIPIYLDFNFNVHDMVTIYMDLGIKNYLNLSSSLSNVRGTYATWGVYPQYSDLVLDYTTGLSQFCTETQFSKSTNLNLNINNSMDLMTVIGARVKLKDKQFFPLYLDFGLGYQYSLITPCKNIFVSLMEGTTGLTTEEKALMTYTIQGGEVILPLTKFVSEIKRNIFTFNFTLTYKF